MLCYAMLRYAMLCSEATAVLWREYRSGFYLWELASLAHRLSLTARHVTPSPRLVLQRCIVLT